MPHHAEDRGPIAAFIDGIEETLIAVILGLMCLITFYNVVLRYVFTDSIIWGQEVVLILFAWLVLLGMSYAVKKTAHLGVDAVTAALPMRGQRVLAVVAALACVVYAGLLMKGAWDYWAPYAALPVTSGRWVPTGIEMARDRAFYVTDQVPMLDIFRWLEGAINQGEAYDKLPRVIPYLALPLGVGLLLLRFVQALIGIVTGARHGLIVSHEAEDAVAELSANPRMEGLHYDEERG